MDPEEISLLVIGNSGAQAKIDDQEKPLQVFGLSVAIKATNET